MSLSSLSSSSSSFLSLSGSHFTLSFPQTMFPLCLLLLLLSLFTSIHSQTPKGLLINCGATVETQIDGRRWLPDSQYVSSGIPRFIPVLGLPPTLSTIRSFPVLEGHHKFCYVVPVFRYGKYLVRTSYFYGGFDGRDSPPVFDQIVDGTVWGTVNTTEDYRRGLQSYYEGVFLAKGKTMSVCLARKPNTDSEMFISTLETVLLGDSVYNSTDFEKHGLGLVARHNFGYSGPILKFPDDQFDRCWGGFTDNNPTINITRNVSVSGIWNLPPSKVFYTALTSNELKPMELLWPSIPLKNSSYYIALYFADNRDSSLDSLRIFNITINGIQFYSNLSPSSSGLAVFATLWPLSGLTRLTLTPDSGTTVGPLIIAGEVFHVLELEGRTITRDVKALERVRSELKNPPLDWSGDPCLPLGYSWTGVICSEGPHIRVVALNLSSMGLYGSLSPSISNLTALTDILLGNNNLMGSIPDLSSLRSLERLHLQDNRLSGEIPPSLGDIIGLQELFIQNNYLTGQVPNSLKEKPGLNLQTSGNQFSLSTPTPST